MLQNEWCLKLIFTKEYRNIIKNLKEFNQNCVKNFKVWMILSKTTLFAIFLRHGTVFVRKMIKLLLHIQSTSAGVMVSKLD